MMFKSIAYVRKTARGRKNGVLGDEKKAYLMVSIFQRSREPLEEELLGQKNTSRRNLCLRLHICI